MLDLQQTFQQVPYINIQSGAADWLIRQLDCLQNLRRVVFLVAVEFQHRQTGTTSYLRTNDANKGDACWTRGSGVIMGEEIEDSLGATKEGSATDWTGTTIAPALSDTKETTFQGGAVTEVRAGDATGVERERKRGAPRSLKPPAKKGCSHSSPRS